MVYRKDLEETVNQFAALIPDYLEKDIPFKYLKLLKVTFDYKCDDDALVDTILDHYSMIQKQRPQWSADKVFTHTLYNFTYSLVEWYYGAVEDDPKTIGY